MTAPLILHVLDHALPEASGYAVRSHNLLRAQQAAGFSVIAVTPSSTAGAPAADNIDGVEYVRLPLRTTDTRQTPNVLARRVLGLGKWLNAELRRRRYSLVHAHTPVLNALPALLASRRTPLPLAYEVRGVWEDTVVDRDTSHSGSWRYRASRNLETLLLRRADVVFTISRGLANEIIDRGVAADRVFLAPNGVDTVAFQPRAADADLIARHDLAGRGVIGFIGYFHAYEGVEVLVRAFALVLARLPEARLLLVGEGEKGVALRAEVTRLGIGDSVIFAGVVPHREIGSYYSVCDVLVYPRLSLRTTELTTPLKPLEAMAMGKAVVASAVGGLSELVRHDDIGILFPPSDVEQLAEALVGLLADAAARARLGEQARRFVCAERTWEHTGRIYGEVYERLLSAAGRGGSL